VVGKNLAEDERGDLMAVAHVLRISKNFPKSRGYVLRNYCTHKLYGKILPMASEKI